MGWIVWALTLVFHAALAVLLARYFGFVYGAIAYGLSVASFMSIAAVALSRSSVGVVTWKNRLAGWFLPWTFVVGGGSLTELIAKNGVASLIFGMLMMICDQVGWLHEIVGIKANDKSPRFSWGELIILWATVICWLVLSAGWLLLLRSALQNQLNSISVLLKGPGNQLPFWLPPIAVGVSMGLRWVGYSGLALTVVVIPLLIVTGPLLLMMLVFLWYYIIGKPIRWN